MIAVPNDGKIWLYGPALDDVESEPVFEEDYDQLPELRKYMLEIMRRTKAIGISAPQVGVFKQFVLVEMEDGQIVDMINPDIVGMFGKELMGTEACLSVPPVGNECLVPRMERITVEFSTSKHPDNIGTVQLGRREAAVVQHEIDHLTGTFFFDRVATAVKRNVLDRLTSGNQESYTMVSQSPSPLIASNIVCSACGVVVEPKFVQNKNGGVEAVEYDHRNEEKGCCYKFRTKVYAVGSMHPMRADGTEIQL